MNFRLDVRVFVASMSLVSLTFMYIRIVPINVETQPFFFMLSLCILCPFLNINLRAVPYDVVFALVFIFFILIHTTLSWLAFGSGALLAGIKYLIGPTVYIIARYSRHHFSPLVLSCVVVIFCFYVVCSQLFGEAQVRSIIMLPQRMVQGRLSIMTPEPSYYAIFLMFFLTYRLYVLSTVSDRDGRATSIILITMGLLTGSAYVLLVILGYLASISYARNSGRFWVLLAVIALGCAVLMLVTIFGPPNRLQHVLYVLYEVFSGQKNWEYLLFGAETSGSTRLILSYVAYSAPFYTTPWGLGVGGFGSTWVDLASLLEIPIHRHEVLSSEFGFAAPTYLANAVAEMGIVSIFVPLILFSNNSIVEKGTPHHAFSVFAWFSLALLILFQCQITNPVPWLIAALMKRPMRLSVKFNTKV